MSKNAPKRLSLKAETLRQLACADLIRVAGGGKGEDKGEGARRTAQCNSVNGLS